VDDVNSLPRGFKSRGFAYENADSMDSGDKQSADIHIQRKIGVPVLLLRNIHKSYGRAVQCTRLQVTVLKKQIIV